MFAAWALSALAAPEAAEEIVVWGDTLLRWERRWYVQTELSTPGGLRLLSEKNREVTAATLQVRAVLSCNRDFPMGPQLEEVGCVIEDVGLIVLPARGSNDGQQVVEETDATLTGATIQLQVSVAGTVPYVDIEGIPAHDERTRQRAEQLRLLAARLMLPFHLKLPETARNGAQWPEEASRLMSMPSDTGSGGGSRVVHRMDLVGDNFIVQSIGEGNIAQTVGAEVMFERYKDVMDVQGLPVDNWAMTLTSVGVIERATGILRERVWAVHGSLTGSSPQAISGAPYVHLGRFRVLDEVEHPDVGKSYVASMKAPIRPGDPPQWVAMEP